MCYSPWDGKESDMTEQLILTLHLGENFLNLSPTLKFTALSILPVLSPPKVLACPLIIALF